MLKAFKTRLNPNNAQATLLAKHAGAARWAYNWGLAEKKLAREQGQKAPSNNDLRKRLTVMKHQDPKFYWLNEVSRYAPDQALHHLDTAFDNFFRNLKRGKVSFPRFKSRFKGLGSFELYGAIRVVNKKLILPKIGAICLFDASYVPTSAKIKYCTVSERSGKWYASVLCEVDDMPPPTKKPWGIVGVDLGIKSLAVISNGITIAGDNNAASRRKVERLSRNLSRCKKGSNRFKKAKRKLNSAHEKIRNKRNYVLHSITKRLAVKSDAIGIENLNVSGMMKNGKLARAIGEKGFGDFRLKLEYKSKWYNASVYVADRFFASSKTCSKCGAKRETLSLSERVFSCHNCGFEIDRDLNAAINLKNVAANLAETKNGRGESVRPIAEEIPTEAVLVESLS